MKNIVAESKGKKDEGIPLEEQSDATVWMKFNVMLQTVDELFWEHGKTGDASRQLRVLAQELCRRGIMVYQLEAVTEDVLETRYAVVEQLVSGWPDTPNVQQIWRIICDEFKKRGLELPSRTIGVKTGVMGSQVGKRR